MRLFVAPAELAAGERTIGGDEHHYLMRVRRARVGDAVELVDGAGRVATGTIARITADTTVVAVGEPTAIVARPPWIRALIPVIKGDRMDVCLEKLVEVGADEIIVWPATRAVVRLDRDKRDARIAKYQAAAQAAARQSGRAAVPTIHAADDLLHAIAHADADLARFVLDPAADARLALDPTTPAPAHVTFASGPEGGLTPDELAAFDRAGFRGVSLGPRILRAETAPVVAVALIRALTAT